MLFLAWLVNAGLIYTLITSIVYYLPGNSWQAIVLMVVTLVLIVFEIVATGTLFVTTT